MNHEVDAAVVLGSQFDPRAYLFPYLAVVANIGMPGTIVSALMTAVGMLKEHGWELADVRPLPDDVTDRICGRAHPQPNGRPRR